jgi:P4 family phage/plasmid primase-like protien
LSESKININDVADQFIREHNQDGIQTLYFYQGDFWEYKTNRYNQIEEKEILRAYLYKWVELKYGTISNSQWTAIERAVRYKATISAREMPSWFNGSPQASHQYVSLQNGILDLNKLLNNESDFIQTHTPMWFSTHCLPFSYEASAQCPQWLKFLHEVFTGDEERIQLIQEWFGYCLTPDTSQHKAINLYGPPRAGKSTVARILQGLLGNENVSSQRLENFGRRFQYQPVIGKLVNICEEATGMRSEAVKTFIAADIITDDRKGRTAVQFRPTARLVIVSNEQLAFKDNSGATDSRLMIVPFDNSYLGCEDLTLQERLEGELAGIFLWAIEGLKKLRERGSFIRPQRSIEEGEELRKANHSTEQFLKDTFKRDDETWFPTIDMFHRYLDFCDNNGIPPSERMSHPKFTTEVRRIFRLKPSVAHRFDGRPPEKALKGITLNDEMI